MVAEGIFPKISGDAVYASEYNYQSGNVLTLTAGENLTAGNVAYIKKSDGKAYLSDTGTADDIRANGLVIATATSGNPVTIITRGLYTTSGLTANDTYYLGASGAVSQTQSGVQIGYSYSTTQLMIDIIQDDRDPVGTIKSYATSFTGVPSNNITAFWKICSGAVLSDAESPLNGQTLPDLNSTQRFLRGSTTSGSTGGSDSHVHKVYDWDTGTSNVAIASDTGGNDSKVYDSSGAAINPTNTDGCISVDMYTTSVSTLPSYYEVTYYMKVK